MTKEEANEMYLLVKEETDIMFAEWSEERKKRFLKLIKQKLKESVNNGRTDNL